MAHKDGLCVSYFILACAIVISSGFVFWLYEDTDLIKSNDLKREIEKLILYERDEDELKLRREVMAEIYDDEIDIIWLPFVESETNGYIKFQMYFQLLISNPDYEIIYKDIADLIDSAPEEFQEKDKTRYLKEIMAIEGVHQILLERYDLLVSDENK